MALAAAAVALNRSGLDLAITRLAFDPVAARFPWRDHAILAQVLHEGAKWLSVVAALAVLGLAAAAARPAGRLRPCRDALAYLAVASIASAAAVALARSFSAHSCPWDLAAFGGRFEFYPIFGARPAASGPGRCLPSGHAATGFMWIAAVYALRRLPGGARRVRARYVAAAVVAFGLVASATQLVRGAHFASHVLWTAAICWTVALVLSLAWPARQRAAERPG